MKTFLPGKKGLKQLALISALVIASFVSYSQNTELVFHNPTLISGNALQDGAKYKFDNVANGIYAVVEILGRSSGNIIVNNIDVSNTGFDKAFQPELGKTGTMSSNNNWWVEFEVTFYSIATNQKISISQFQATSIDTDGDDGSLREYVVMEKINSYLLANNTGCSASLLAPMSCGSSQTGTNAIGIDEQITGSYAQHNGIDTTALNLMTTYTYTNKSVIRFRYGGTTGNSSSTSAMRLNSLWFKSFSTLPVNLVSFNAKYNAPAVTLNWTTASETGFSHFEVERCTDRINFTTSAIVFANGNGGNDLSQYSFKDNVASVKEPVVYYRLKMVDMSGASRYSDVIAVRLIQQPAISISTFPNPATSEIRVSVPASWQNNKLQYSIFNMTGMQVKTTSTNGSATDVIKISDLSPGTYMIKVSNGTETATQRFIKVN